MKHEFSWQIFEKYSNIKFHENPSSGSRVVLYGRTDITKLIVAFRNFAKAPKNQPLLVKKPAGPHLVNKFPAFYGTRRFITAFTRARNLSSQVNPVTTSHPMSWTSISILSHLRQGQPSSLFPSSFSTKPYMHTSSTIYVLHAPSISFFSEEYRS